MNEDETLIILTPGFAASTTDSTCLPMHQDFVRILKELYPRLKIIILSFQYPYKSGAYELFGATVISFNGRNHGGIRKLILRRKISNMLLNIHRKGKIIGLLSFWYGECALEAKIYANKHVISHHCWILGQDARKANRYPVKITPSPEELVALSDFIQDEF
ncbi:MAG: hypothetical protein ACJ749_07105, partial [Flavisolibacter sp.]